MGLIRKQCREKQRTQSCDGYLVAIMVNLQPSKSGFLFFKPPCAVVNKRLPDVSYYDSDHPTSCIQLFQIELSFKVGYVEQLRVAQN